MNAANPSSSICRCMNPVNVTDNVARMLSQVKAVSGDWSKDVVKVVRILWSTSSHCKMDLHQHVFGPLRFRSRQLGAAPSTPRPPRNPKASKDSLEVFSEETHQVATGNLKKIHKNPGCSSNLSNLSNFISKAVLPNPPNECLTHLPVIFRTPPWPIHPTPKSTD